MMYGEPLCGWAWFQTHKNDVTQADIDSLGIVIAVSGKVLPAVSTSKKDRGIVKDLVKSYREVGRE